MSKPILLSHPTSPFVRKVHVALHALGLFDQVQLESMEIGPVRPNAKVLANNPTGQIPVLILENGFRLHDSRVILEYLDTLSGQGRLFPADGDARWQVLVLASVADALLVSAINILREAGRPDGLRWDAWPDVQRGKIENALDSLHQQATEGLLGDEIDAGTLGLACAWEFLVLREEKLGLRLATWPGLAAWFARISRHDSIRRTSPASATAQPA